MTVKREKRQRNRKEAGEELRTVAVCMRLAPYEVKMLDDRRGKIQRGTYMRLLLNNTYPPVIPAINAEAYTKLNNASADLGKLARNVDDIDTVERIKATQELIKQIRQILIQIYFTARKSYESED